jgi:hypothetical protein
MSPRFRPSAGRCAAAGLACVALATGCTNLRIHSHAQDVEQRFLGAPATQALQALGPTRDRPVADLRAYTWETGRPTELGGNCRLTLVADPRGIVVDYVIEGTPLGCERLLGRS